MNYGLFILDIATAAVLDKKGFSIKKIRSSRSSICYLEAFKVPSFHQKYSTIG
jgi:hypothetical protein